MNTSVLTYFCFYIFKNRNTLYFIVYVDCSVDPVVSDRGFNSTSVCIGKGFYLIAYLPIFFFYIFNNRKPLHFVVYVDCFVGRIISDRGFDSTSACIGKGFYSLRKSDAVTNISTPSFSR